VFTFALTCLVLLVDGLPSLFIYIYRDIHILIPSLSSGLPNRLGRHIKKPFLLTLHDKFLFSATHEGKALVLDVYQCWPGINF
jgi:hypothetical protein